MATQPRTLEETMFQMDDIEFNAAQGDLDDLELDHDYLSRLIPTLLRPETPIGAALERNAIYCTISSRGCLHRLAESFNRIGYGSAHVVSSAAAATIKKGSFHSLRHEHISINLDNQEYIVDPSFKDHFEVPTTTTRYAAILDLIPDTVVVAPRRQLLRAVALLATELQRCFEARNVPLPPWRRFASLFSKWEAASQLTITTHWAVSAVVAPSAALAPAMPITKTSIKAPAGTRAVAHSFPQASPFPPQSVLENQGLLEAGFRAYSRKYVGFQIGMKEDECFCCGLRKRMVKLSTQQDMIRVSHSAPAA